MIKQLEVFLIDSDLASFEQSISFPQRLVENVKEPFHAELIHSVHLEQLGHREVKVSCSDRHRGIHGACLL